MVYFVSPFVNVTPPACFKLFDLIPVKPRLSTDFLMLLVIVTNATSTFDPFNAEVSMNGRLLSWIDKASSSWNET